ncbi:MAG: prepilin-type N-terminal cleavage/methylation domain-containing protein [Bryobacteraceae bacterium]
MMHRSSTGSRRSDRTGVTLLELIIVITLLSLLTLGMAMTIGRRSIRWTEPADGCFPSRRTVGAQRVLDQQVAGLMPVLFSCSGSAGTGMLFFDGAPDSMRMVSSFTLEEASRGYPRILEYAAGSGNGLRVRLVVNESITTRGRDR